MKTWRLTPILTSAYLSAMLTSGLAPIRPSVIFAAAVDPMAAQKVLQNAVSAMASSGWALPTAMPSPLPSFPQVSASTQIPKADPVMTAELMSRIINFAKSQEGHGLLDAKICAVLKLCNGTADLPVRQLETENPEGHYFMMPTPADSTDIIIVKRNADGLDIWLTDRTFKLRMAAISRNGVASVIANEKALESFKSELALMAREASTLPPAVAAGS